MVEDIKLIDLIIEIVDARIPLASRNPDIDDLAKNKTHANGHILRMIHQANRPLSQYSSLNFVFRFSAPFNKFTS